MDLPVPQHAVLMLQPKCNMECSFCVTEDTMGVMGFAESQRLLRSLKKQGFVSAIFGGGEPFFWPHDFREILRYAKDLGLKTQVGTNAIKLSEDVIAWDFVDRWVIPVDGVTAEAHNLLRQFRRRHHQVITDALGRLKKAGRSVTISTVVTQINIHEVTAIGEYLRQLQSEDRQFIHAWHLYKFLPFGRGGRVHQQKLQVPDQAYEVAVSQAQRLGLPFQVFKRKDMLLSKAVEFYWVEGGQLMAQSRSLGTRPLQITESD